MKRRDWKLAGVVSLIWVMVCVVAYAAKHKEISLPDAVKAAVSAMYPQAAIEKTEMEKESLPVYSMELKQNGHVFELTVAPDGTIVDSESVVALSELPDAVKAAIAKAAEGATVKEVKKEVTYWVVRLVKLDKPNTTYEAELVKDGKELTVEFAADGTVLEQKAKVKEGKEGKDEKEGKENEEEQVSIDKVPAAVKTTLLKEAQGGTIGEIERSGKDGNAVYEAKVTISGKEIEIKVANDGKLLGKGTSDEHKEKKGHDDDDK